MICCFSLHGSHQNHLVILPEGPRSFWKSGKSPFILGRSQRPIMPLMLYSNPRNHNVSGVFRVCGVTLFPKSYQVCAISFMGNASASPWSVIVCFRLVSLGKVSDWIASGERVVRASMLANWLNRQLAFPCRREVVRRRRFNNELPSFLTLEFIHSRMWIGGVVLLLSRDLVSENKKQYSASFSFSVKG